MWTTGSELFNETLCPLEWWLVLTEINFINILKALLLFENGLLSHHDILKLYMHVKYEETNGFRETMEILQMSIILEIYCARQLEDNVLVCSSYGDILDCLQSYLLLMYK